MTTVNDDQIFEYVVENIDSFHEKRLESLKKLKLNALLHRKNPYLFKSKNFTQASDFVRSLLDAHLSSQEETLFGQFLEGLAIHVAGIVHDGKKSGIPGIDLEFTKENARYIVSIKSGPNWGNSSQIARLKDNFSSARRVIRQGDISINVISVNGCCYGRDNKPDKGEYFKYCGQQFWELISNDNTLYTRIIEPLGHDAKKRNDSFMQQYGAVINLMSKEFLKTFCNDNGTINWSKLVAFSSAKSNSRGTNQQ